MDSFDAFEDKEFEQLNDAILKAIISSQDVENVLKDFKSKNLINEMAVVNLILSLDELSDLMFSEKPDKGINKPELSARNQDKKKQREHIALTGNATEKTSRTSSSDYFIDGKILSRNEILFEKYYQGRFNEKKWLKQAKIRS